MVGFLDGGAVPPEQTVIRGEEFSYSGWVNRTSPAQVIDIHTDNVKYVNCLFHDFSNIGLWTDAIGTEMNGCLMYHNGWSAPDRGHGHGLYIQNNTPEKVIKDCIIFDNFGWGIHAYTETGKIDNIVLDGCVCFGAGSLYGAEYNNILVGGYHVANNITIRNCMTYGAGGVNIGYYAGATNVILENNYFPDGITKVNAQITTETGNYYGPATGNRVFLRINEHDPKRANLVIYNEAKAETVKVEVPFTGIVQARNVQDYFKDILTLEVIDGVIEVPMTGHTVAAPVGWAAPATTFPQFGCFVLTA